MTSDGVDRWFNDDFNEYMAKHDEAVRWAELNREFIAKRFLQAIRSDGHCTPGCQS